MKREKRAQTAVVLLALLVLLAAVFGPEQLACYRDQAVLNRIVLQEEDNLNEGYRYKLSNNEKLYLLSECLKRQDLPQSELDAMTRVPADVDYEDLMGSYAFVMNRQGPSEKELTEEQIYTACNREMGALKERKIFSEGVREVSADAYNATLYSAIDVLEPQNNMAVWRVSLSTIQKNADKTNRLIEAYLDAYTGRMYGFYVRTEHTWAQMDPDDTMDQWCAYLSLGEKETYEEENPLLETASYYRKYRIAGMEEAYTVVTIGFYEGINEFFIKVT